MSVYPKRGAKSSWISDYAKKHRWLRITDFPEGIEAPGKVRLYKRHNHYMLQWWDPRAKKNVSERVDSDLIAAIVRAREIDANLECYRSSGVGPKKLRHADLLDAYREYLQRRADAGELSVKTVSRYGSALKHYEAYIEDPDVASKYAFANRVDADHALGFKAFLRTRSVAPNGHPNGTPRSLKAIDFVVSAVRSMFAWATREDSGPLLPHPFQNPFKRASSRREQRAETLFGEPDITIEMATRFVAECDAYQLRLFAPIMLFGLRAAEPCLIFREDLDNEWLHVVNRPQLGIRTKGLRDKRFPLSPWLLELLRSSSSWQSPFLFTRRSIATATADEPAWTTSEQLEQEFRERCHSSSPKAALDQAATLRQLCSEVGAIKYDHIQTEFGRVTKGLDWPREATLKDFRHLFSTCLENSGVALFYRRYLMGQSPGRSAVVTYTHLNDLKSQYQLAADRDLAPLIDAIRERTSIVASQGQAA